MTLTSLYDDLAQWQWRRRHRAGLVMRKRLLPTETFDDVDAWLLELSGVSDEEHVLDVGCGFGATLMAWRRVRGINGTGITLSGFQARCATEEIRRLGYQDSLSVVVGDYDRPPGGPFDVAVGIECLCHAPDLASTLRAVAEVVPVGGRLIALEDVASDPSVGDSDFGKELRRRWYTERLWCDEDWDRALAAAGWRLSETHDLTPYVPAAAGPGRGDLRYRMLRMLRGVLPTSRSRNICDAFLGGIALERLYGEGRMRYRVLSCVRESGA